MRGVSARVTASASEVRLTEVSEVMVGSQRILKALGLLLCRVGALAKEDVLDSKSETFLPDLTQVLRAVFAFFRSECSERGLRDVSALLRGEDACRKVLRMLGVLPAAPRGACVGHVPPGVLTEKVSGSAPAVVPVLRVATWNVCGGMMSAQAPATWSLADQRAAIMAEILR